MTVGLALQRRSGELALTLKLLAQHIGAPYSFNQLISQKDAGDALLKVRVLVEYSPAMSENQRLWERFYDTADIKQSGNLLDQ